MAISTLNRQSALAPEKAYWPEKVYWFVSGAMILCFAVTLAIVSFDGRTIDGSISVWAKPLKFELSLAIHAATLALVMTILKDAVRSSRAMSLVALVFLAACLAEMSYIIIQAANAEHSHFNISTPFNRFMWSMMAFAAIIIVGAAAVIGMTALLGAREGVSTALKWAIVLGMVGGTLLTMYTAFTIGARMSPYIGAVPAGAEDRMMLTGWSLVGGDLRVSHFLATHMIQIVPLIGLAVGLLPSKRVALLLVVAAALFLGAASLLEYSQALSGLPSPIAAVFS